MILMIRGLMAQMLDFTRAVGKGSNAQVDGFIFLMMSSTSRCVISEKQQRGWEVPDGGLTAGAGKAGEELERRERMVSTLVLKKAIQLLHCSSVVPVYERVCGLRRWFTVEKSCLELPGLLLMMLE